MSCKERRHERNHPCDAIHSIGRYQRLEELGSDCSYAVILLLRLLLFSHAGAHGGVVGVGSITPTPVDAEATGTMNKMLRDSETGWCEIDLAGRARHLDLVNVPSLGSLF